MNNETPYNNNIDYENESSYSNQNENNSNTVSYIGIILILLFSFGSQCLKCKFQNNNNNNLKHVIIKDLEDNLIKECSICLNEMKIDDKLIILPCKHYYHKECIAEWFKKSKTCPECRIPI